MIWRGSVDTFAAMKARINGWLDSDLVGIPATAYTFFVLAVSFLVFRVGGGVAGIVVAVALWIPMVVFAIRGVGRPAERIRVDAPPPGHRHRVLVIANQGLDDPALCSEVCRRGERIATEAMILAPVVASSALAGLADDVDRELETARGRVDSALHRLRSEGVVADGRADIAQPMESLADGLREFPPNEILMLPDLEANWESAEDLAERIRAEVGLPVTAIGPSARALGPGTR